MLKRSSAAAASGEPKIIGPPPMRQKPRDVGPKGFDLITKGHLLGAETGKVLLDPAGASLGAPPEPDQPLVVIVEGRR